MTAGSYGSAGWLEDDRRVLLYDRYDLWAVDPTGEAGPEAVTGGYGREQNIRFRLIRLDQDDPALPDDEPFLFSAFHERPRTTGSGSRACS